MSANTKGVLNAIAAAASYGTNPLFALPLYVAGMEVNSVLFYRYAFAVLIYGFWLKFIKKVSLQITFKQGVCLAVMALFFASSSLTLFSAFKYMEAGLACTILFIYPILVALIMALFFHEKIDKILWVSIAMITVGVVALYNGGEQVRINAVGLAWVLASAWVYAIYIVMVRKAKPVAAMNGAKLSFYVMLFGLVFFVLLLKGGMDLQPLTSPWLCLCAVALALFPTIISLETLTVAIQIIGSTSTAIIGALEPVTALFIGILLFGEHLTPKIAAGVCLILLGVILVIRAQHTQKSGN